MKKANSKRLLTLVLAVVLVFALSVSAFATWSSFQGRNTNNGRITLQPPITSSATSTPVTLETNGTFYVGVDAASVIQSNYAFTLYNGGVSGDNGVGGARMQATNLTTAAKYWNIQLDADASNSFLLSTPYYDSNSNTIYAAVTYTDSSQNYHWRLYSISGALTSTPTKSSVLASGDGQINTHINAIGNYLFFGGYGGEHAYYQYGPINGTASLKKFIPSTQEDFYYAGASKVNEDSTSYVVFGSESGKIYVRPVGATFGTATGSTINLAASQPDCGPIRSSISVVGSTWYLTSKGSGSNGYLWRITDGTTSSPTLVSLALSNNSTSTPVVSSNNYVYFGCYSGFTSGNVYAVPTSFTGSTTPISIYSGDPVQCSPIVYSSVTEDYVYFTTNSATGAGYCYKWDTDDASAPKTKVWEREGTGTGYEKAALQGFAASDSGTSAYLVYGDDGNHLYIIH